MRSIPVTGWEVDDIGVSRMKIYSRSNGATGHFYMDTTAFDNGVHTLQWTAAYDAGNKDGIGSRYFTTQNIGGSEARKAQGAWRKARNAGRLRRGSG